MSDDEDTKWAAGQLVFPRNTVVTEFKKFEEEHTARYRAFLYVNVGNGVMAQDLPWDSHGVNMALRVAIETIENDQLAGEQQKRKAIEKAREAMKKFWVLFQYSASDKPDHQPDPRGKIGSSTAR